jgi:hypothetical protein
VKNSIFSNEREDDHIVLTSIKIPDDILDKHAEQNGIMGNLSHSGSDLVIKTPYIHSRNSEFNAFDGRERIETIISLLRREIDFENFMLQGVILEHFPMHNDELTVFEDLFKRTKYNLMKGFITGNFHDHFVAVNYLKTHFGEKYAFEFAFLIHYQAWLLFPTIAGVCLVFY